ncbi:hypothetical protein FRC07_004968 [Ceratobasidium sp. 392]|nr:hypothetical protein FRC07_004968 [Ceratobasidium sp. 392]
MSLFTIPEVALHLLSHLPAARYDDTSVRTLVACTKVSRALRAIAQTDSVWFRHYVVRWSRPDFACEPGQQPWYTLYCTRREKDLQTLVLLEILINTPSKRGETASKLVELNADAWDALRIEAACKVPEGVKDVWRREEREWDGERWKGVGDEWRDGERKGKDSEDWEEPDTRELKSDWIQRRWWAKQLLGTISRTDAVNTMARIFLNDQPDSRSLENARNFEDGLKALSGLMGVNTSEISHNYDNLATECGRQLVEDGICVDPTKPEFDLKTFSSGVCRWMVGQGFRKAAGDGQYYDLMNHFPHKFMTTNRRALPMSLVCTFVAIVTRLGFLSAPVGFPGHVHAWIALPSYHLPEFVPFEPETDWEDETPTQRLHVDVFNSDVEPFLSSDSMRGTLNNLQVPRDQQPMLMRPSAASEMVLRAANNILHSVTRIQHLPGSHIQAETRGAALYASAMTFLVARPQAADATRFIAGVISVVKEQFPLDADTVLERLSSLIFNQEPARAVGIHLRNALGMLRSAPVNVNKRTKERWWVGMMFRHARYNYVGVILGWDAECAASEEWMREAGVDELPRGRKQPFYNVLAADGSFRYVAEENVIPLPSLATETHPEQKVTWGVVRALMLVGTFAIEQTFSRVEVDEELGRAWFVPAVNTAQEYPDDTPLGQAYMNSPWHRYDQ